MPLSKQRLLIFGLIILGVLIVGFFGLGTIRAFRQFHGHRPPPPFGEHIETDVELIRDWMTIPFIAKMYRVPPPVLFKALGIHEFGNKQKSLKQLNEEYYPQADGIVIEKIKATVLTEIANRPGQAQPVSNTPTAP